MARKLSAAQAKSQLADCLRRAEKGEPVIITRHGKPVAALVGVDRVALPKRRDAVRAAVSPTSPEAGKGLKTSSRR